MGVWPTYGAIKIERGKISKKARGGAKAKGSLTVTPLSMNFGAPMQHGRGRILVDFVDFEGSWIQLRVTSGFYYCLRR